MTVCRRRGGQQFVDLRYQLPDRLKRLRQKRIGTDKPSLFFVKRLERTDKQDHRNFIGGIIAPQFFTDRISIRSGHIDVGQNYVGPRFVYGRQGAVTVTDSLNVETFVREGKI